MDGPPKAVQFRRLALALLMVGASPIAAALAPQDPKVTEVATGLT